MSYPISFYVFGLLFIPYFLNIFTSASFFHEQAEITKKTMEMSVTLFIE